MKLKQLKLKLELYILNQQIHIHTLGGGIPPLVKLHHQEIIYQIFSNITLDSFNPISVILVVVRNQFFFHDV
jgi:hypothetical protein